MDALQEFLSAVGRDGGVDLSERPGWGPLIYSSLADGLVEGTGGIDHFVGLKLTDAGLCTLLETCHG